MRSGFVAVAVVIGLGFLSRDVAAQNAAAAEALFQKGHQLFETSHFAEACPLFAESFRLDPLTGSLLALASCHEAEGKLASAWSEYADVAARSQRENRLERADAARKRARDLEPKLGRVTVILAQEAVPIAGLVIRRDGTVVGPGTYGTAIPVDRGEHVIEASAAGRVPFSQRLTVEDGTTLSVAIPGLVLAQAAPPSPTPTTPTRDAPPSSGFPYRTVGLVTLLTGVAVGGVGAYFGVTAIDKNQESINNGCNTADICDPRGKATRLEARSDGNVSTALFIVGGVVAASGLAIVLFGPSKPNATNPPVTMAPALGREVAGLSMSGRF